MSIADAVRELEEKNEAWRVRTKAAHAERDDALAALAAMTRERDEFKRVGGIDPSKWRGPRGGPREDDTHRWREATVDGVTELLRCVWHRADDYWWSAFGRNNIAPTIDAACAAADEYVAGLQKPKEKMFEVERSREAALAGHGGWRCNALDTGYSTASFVAGRVLLSCGGTRIDEDDFVLDHAALFRDGGSIAESEVKAWIAARGGK